MTSGAVQHLAQAGVAAVPLLEVDELAGVVPDLDHGHGVVLRHAQVVHLQGPSISTLEWVFT